MKQGWDVKKLGEVLQKTETTDPTKKPNEEFVYLDVSSVNKETKEIENAVVLLGKDAPSRARKLVKTDDVIFATVRPTHSRVALITKKYDEQVCSTGYFVLRGKEFICNKYLFYFLLTEELNRQMQKLQKGASYPAVTDSDVKNILLRYPKSLPEQQKIVTILDEAFAAIEGAKANAIQNLKNAKELFDSYLQSVFENRGEGWEEKRLGEIAFVKSGGTPSRAKKEYWEGSIAWYSSGELNDLYTIKPERYINDLAINNSNAKLFPKGSLLIGMYDTAALKMSILDRDAAFNQAIAGVNPNSKIDLIFILHSINSIKPDLLNLRRGVRQKNLSLEKIKNIPIRLPSLSEQKSIVQKLDLLSTETKRLEAIYQQKIDNLEEFKKSILEKAFNGELG